MKVDKDGRLCKDPNTRNVITLSGFMRARGEGHIALEKVLKEKSVLPIRE